MFCTNCGQNLNDKSTFCTNCGVGVKRRKKRKILKKILIGFGVLVLLSFILLYTPSSDDTITTTSNQTDNQTPVVNILCPSSISDDESSGGSGTIISDNGVILTNSHIIPQDKTNIHVDEEGCLVILPNQETGQPDQFYLAHPIVIGDLSDEYDMAFMDIYAAYYDEDEKEYKGVYPRKFPTYKCENNTPQLGDSVRIFGYPSINGGYSLTVTDGIVSSFSGDGIIYTSAKISSGNSGGLAVDKNDCMIGIPSKVSYEGSDSLGIIYSMDLVNQFANEVQTLIDKQR